MKLFLAAILFCSSAFAGLPPTTTKGQSESSKTVTFNFEAPNSQMTLSSPVTRLIETGNKNLLLNASFEHNTATTSWAFGSGASGVQETSVIHAGSGRKSLNMTLTAVTGVALSQDVTPVGDLSGTTLAAFAWVKTTVTTAQLCMRNAGATVGRCATIIGDNVWRSYLVTFPGPASGSVGLSIFTTGSTTGTIYVDDTYVGDAQDFFGAGVPNNTFTARVGSTGTVTDEVGGDWINGNCSVASVYVFTCNFTSSFFTVAPTCFMSSVSGSGNGLYNRVSQNSTTSSVIVESASSGPAASQFNLTCIKTGSDFVQPVITPDLTPQRWSGWLAGSGWTTTSTSFADFAAGTSITATTVNSNGLSCSPIAGSLPGLTCTGGVNGNVYQVCADTSAFGSAANLGVSIALYDGSNIQLTAGVNANTPNTNYSVPFTQCGQVVGSGSSFSVKLRGKTSSGTLSLDGTTFPKHFSIIQVTNGINAPLLLGSITSNENNAARLDQSSVNCSGTSSVTDGQLLSAVGNIASGNCTLTFKTNYATAPKCWANYNSSSASIIQLNVGSVTTSGGTLNCRSQNASTTANCTSVTADVFCLGTR